jgi:IclR family pca regulon transcriptional regulator
VQKTKESCSASTLDLPDIVYVARVPTRRIMSITLGVGTRLPAHATSMGRVLLAGLPSQELDDFLSDATLQAFTDRTITDPDELRATVAKVRDQGWALVDQELEVGLRSVAAPIKSGNGQTIAALNVSASVPRVSLDELRQRMLPELLRTAELISVNLQRATVPTNQH